MLTSEMKALRSWIFEGCKHFRYEMLEDGSERFLCDLGTELRAGCAHICMECERREKEFHFYG